MSGSIQPECFQANFRTCQHSTFSPSTDFSKRSVARHNARKNLLPIFVLLQNLHSRKA